MWAGIALAQSYTFIYQGRLQVGQEPVSGVCSFDFRLFDAASGGTQLGAVVSRPNVPVSDGYFSVELDFGNVFTSTPRYLQVENINCGRPGDPVNLDQRIPLYMPLWAEYTRTAQTADTVDWNDITDKPSGFADNRDDGPDIVCGNNQILRWTSGGWVCANALNDHGQLNGLSGDDHPQYLLTNGSRGMTGALNMSGYRIVNLSQATTPGDLVPYEQAVKVGDTASGDLAGSYPASVIVVGLQGRPVTSTVPITNQVLTWDGTQWGPAPPQTGGPAGGDLSGTYPNPKVTAIQGRSISSVKPLDKQVLSWNSITSQWQGVDVVNPGDLAGGDLSGVYPNPTVAGLQGRAVASISPTDKQVLTWDGINRNWIPADPRTVGPAGGDLSGSYPNPTVSRLQGYPISTTSPTRAAQVLTWNGTAWTPGNITHLQGHLVSGTAPTLGQVLAWQSGQWVPSLVTHLQGRPVSSTAPNPGEVLVWTGGSGGQWLPTPVLKPGDAIGGDFTGTFPNPQLKPGTITMSELNVPMGYGTGTAQFTSNTSVSDLFVLPASFVPDSTGQCLVTVSAYIRSIQATGVADDDPMPVLRTAKQSGTSSPQHDGDTAVDFTPDDVNFDKAITASAGYVWPISSSDVGATVRFGCYVTDQIGNWDYDEQVFCRVSYLCQ
ncbi:MAG: hypothetical protein D6784_05850 [Chloroflexi bacterium]|nr:MAG: hypothetical protein D6784_05850 [Chloroflexota bacterium]